MMHNKMKFDYNNLIRLIMDAVSGKQDDEETQNTAFAIAIGLELLSSYLKDMQRSLSSETMTNCLNSAKDF